MTHRLPHAVRGSTRPIRSRPLSPVGFGLLFGLSIAASPPVFSLPTYDLATLWARADLVVRVHDFAPGKFNAPGRGTAVKVYKGQFTLGSSINITPWAIDFSHGAVPPSSANTQSPHGDVVFFLRGPTGHLQWETVPSGVRVRRAESIFSPRAAGASRYVLAPCQAEVDAPQEVTENDDKDVDHDLLQLAVQVSRARANELSILLATTSYGPAEFEERLAGVLETELRLAYRAASTSDGVRDIVELFARLDDSERLWTLRARLSGHDQWHAGQRLAAHADAEFFTHYLDAANATETTLKFLDQHGNALSSATRLALLDELLVRLTPSARRAFRPNVQVLAFTAAATLYRSTFDTLPPSIEQSFVHLAGTDNPVARYHFHAALRERSPLLAERHFPNGERLFALLEIDGASRSQVNGTVRLRCVRSTHRIESATVTLQRRATDDQTFDKFDVPLTLPARAKLPGEAGEFRTSFRLESRREPLAAGRWSAWLRVERKRRLRRVEPSQRRERNETWRSARVDFRIDRSR